MAAGLHAMLTRHPWLVQAFGSQMLYGAGKARHDDHSLAIYEAAGFTGEQAGQAAATVFTFVLGNALVVAAAASLTRRLSRDGGNAGELIRDHMAEAGEIARQFPQLRARLETADAVDYGAAPEGSFEFGLQAILDGLQAQLTACRPERARHPATAKNHSADLAGLMNSEPPRQRAGAITGRSARRRVALGGDGLMPNTTTTPPWPWPSPRRGHPGLRRALATGQAAQPSAAIRRRRSARLGRERIFGPNGPVPALAPPSAWGQGAPSSSSSTRS